MKRWDVLGFGGVAVDDLLYLDHFPHPDEKMRILGRARDGGGLAGTALVAATRLGATAAWAVFTVFIKHAVHGSALSEVLWVLIAGIIAVGFISHPAGTFGQLDQARTAVGGAAAQGYAAASGSRIGNSAGLPARGYPND